MAARITKSLDKLRSQVNALAPNRSKLSDGWLGDAKHSMRKSDHNPEPDGTVDAFDLTHDPANGVDIQKVCDAIIASRDRRVSYLICNGKIISGNGGPQPWVKRVYKGANKHDKHLHVSVLDAHQDDTSPWGIDSAFRSQPAPKPKPTAPKPRPRDERPTLYTDETTVRGVQARLWDLGYTEVGSRDENGTFDGRIGKMTRTAILAFRNENDLPVTDVIDDEFLRVLATAPSRQLSKERSGATPAEVRKQVPEVKANFLSKAWAWFIGGGAGLVGVGSAAGEADPDQNGALRQVLTIIQSVPGWMWCAALIVIAAAIIYAANKGEKVGIQAFQDGSRR